jgi:hypothetical protein
MGSCELTNEPMGSIKDEEFLDYLRDCELLEDTCLQSFVLQEVYYFRASDPQNLPLLWYILC